MSTTTHKKNTDRLTRKLAAAAVLTALSFAANSEEYDVNRDSELLACDRIYDQGNIQDAINCYSPLKTSSSLHVAAEASWALGDTNRANELFRQAVQQQPRNPHVRARWGRLFLSTHQPSSAAPLFREALLIDPDFLHAKAGLAAALLSQPGAEARKLLAEISIEHPDDVETLLILARLELETKNLDQADKLLDRALKSAAQNNILPLDIYALKAAADMLRDVEDSQWIQKALDISPAYGDIYYVSAHYHLINYRYRETVDVLRKAVAIQPTHWSAHSQLGINLLRLNDIEGAKEHLEIAYGGDPFDTATVNTLKLLDTLDDFKDLDTVATYRLPNDSSDSTVPVVMRLHKSEAKYLSPYVEELTLKAVKSFSERYDFALKEPLIVELFPNHDDFAVRTVSTPGVGLLGVTFGYLLAMDSPSGRPPGEFHWGSTLWHELAHVFTIEKSDHRMPRWFTEGVSVYEEWATGPLRGRHIPVDVLQAIKENKLLPVKDLDSGFVRPTYPNQVTVSYMQAGLICEMISEFWGHDKLIEMLVQFDQRKDTTQAVRTVLGISTEELDRNLQQYIKLHFDKVITEFDTWKELIASMNNAAQSKQWATVIALANQANEIYPEYVADGSTYIAMHSAYEATGNSDKAVTVLETWFENGGHQPDMLHQLAHRLRDQGRTDRATEVLESLNWVSPNNIDLHERLGKDYLNRGDNEAALREFKALLGLDPHDKSVVHLNIAYAYTNLNNNKRATRHVLQALEYAPFFREAQDLLVELTGDSS